MVFADRVRQDRFGEETLWGVLCGGRGHGDQHPRQPACATGADGDADEKALCDGQAQSGVWVNGKRVGFHADLAGSGL